MSAALLRMSQVLVIGFLAGGCGGGADRTGQGGEPAGDPGRGGEARGWIVHAQPHPNPSAAYKWVDILEEAAARRIDKVGARPPIIAREMGVVMEAVYCAWAAYDDRAVGTRTGDTLRRPAAERTQANKETAIAYAACRTLEYVYWDDIPWIHEQMKAMGFDPADTGTDPGKASGIGNLAAHAIVSFRKDDGSNQSGTAPCSNGKPYSDYTLYQPKNPDPKVINDPDRWQPIPFDDGKGGKFAPGFLAPHWYLVKTFILERSDQFRLPGPPKTGSEELKREVAQLIEYNASLSTEQKSVVEFMRDGPRSTGQSGHWLRFAQDLSRRDHYGLDQDVKLFFCIAMVCADGFIACWEEKRYWDSSRPWTLVRWYYRGKKVRGWAGPCKGVVEMPAEEWHPYSPATFVTPPFPAYPSGHATVSGASARTLALFSGSDRFECIERRRAGALTEGNCDLPAMQAVDGKPAADLPKEKLEELRLPTFWSTAEMAAVSRAMGGYHIPTDNNHGLELGRKVADFCWPKFQALFDGTARAGR